MTAELLLGIASIVTSLGTIITVLIAIKSFNVAKKSFLADHERRKKQATIETYNEISSKVSLPLRLAICEAYNETLGAYSYRQIRPTDKEWIGNSDLQFKFITYCRYMERFATGVEIGVFDFDTFNRFSGHQTALLFEQIKPLIDDRNSHRRFCVEFHKFYIELIKSHAPIKPKNADSHIH